MKKVFITRRFPQKAVKFLSDSGFIVDMWDSDEPIDYSYMVQKSKDVDGIICTLSDKINANFINSAHNLKVISTMSVGFDHIDVAIAQSRNIKIGYTPNVLTDATAELAVGLLLSVSRRLIEGVKVVKDGTWGAWKPFWMCGSGLKDSVVGIVGLGSIGKAIAMRISPFLVKSILACGSKELNTPINVELNSNCVVQKVSFDEVLKNSDFVIVSCALTDKTTNLLNESAFEKMKSNSILVNVSRGPVVDQDALYKALIDKRIAAAALDVCTPEPLPTDHPLLSLPNCVVIPHLGSATIDTRNSMCQLAVENLLKGLQGTTMTSELKI